MMTAHFMSEEYLFVNVRLKRNFNQNLWLNNQKEN